MVTCSSNAKLRAFLSPSSGRRRQIKTVGLVNAKSFGTPLRLVGQLYLLTLSGHFSCDRVCLWTKNDILGLGLGMICPLVNRSGLLLCTAVMVLVPLSPPYSAVADN